MTFHSTKITVTGPDAADVTGDLTLHGVTHPVTLKAKLNSPVQPDEQGLTVGFEVSGHIKRSDFGVTKYLPLIGDDSPADHPARLSNTSLPDLDRPERARHMNGAESLVRTLADAGVGVCFANPGTLGDAFRRRARQRFGHPSHPRPVRGRGNGHADGTAGCRQTRGDPAASGTGPRQRPGQPAQRPTRFRRRSSTSSANTPPITRSMTRRSPRISPDSRGPFPGGCIPRRAPRPSRPTAPGGRRLAVSAGPDRHPHPAANTAWEEAEGPAPAAAAALPPAGIRRRHRPVAQALRSGRRAALLMRGEALGQRGLETAGRIAAASGARLMSDTVRPTDRPRRGAVGRRTYSLLRRADRGVSRLRWRC